VYFVRNCPGLHGHKPKPRFVVVVHPDKADPRDGRILVVPISSSSLSKFLVPMPNKDNHPGCRSGLNRRCDAVCDEPKTIPLEDLDDLRGSISLALINRILGRLSDYLKEKGVK
jgi:mRNA-degrading endonuclease toxin of MazEF toxin-antitoxin module